MEKALCLLKEGSGAKGIVISRAKKTWPPFCAGNKSLFLHSNCCGIPCLVFRSCLLPRNWPEVAGVQGFTHFCQVAEQLSECSLAGFVV